MDILNSRVVQKNVSAKYIWDNVLELKRQQFMKEYLQEINADRTPSDFEILSRLGEGTFGQVFAVRDLVTGKLYALKVINRPATDPCVLSEIQIAKSVNFPFCLRVVHCFKMNQVCVVMPLLTGGDMFKFLNKMVKFEEPLSKFFGAQVIMGIEYLHYCQVLYRDLKPENILIDNQCYIKLIDFGFSKLLNTGRTYTNCGTPEYQAPEIILSQGYGKQADWWAFGVLLFEMSCGRSPFFDIDAMAIYAKIVDCKYDFPPNVSDELKHLVTNILQVNVTKRYGNLRNGIEDIKNHKWFEGMDYLGLYSKNIRLAYTVNGSRIERV